MHESEKGHLIFTVGLARSGKSTIAKEWVHNPFYQATDNPGVVVDSDYIRKALHGMRYVTLAEPMVHAIKMVMIRALLDSGHDVMCDDTNTTEKSIKNMFELDPDAKVFIVKTDIETCIDRANTTNQFDLIPVIRRMWNNLLNLSAFGAKNPNFWLSIEEKIESIRKQTKAAYVERVATE